MHRRETRESTSKNLISLEKFVNAKLTDRCVSPDNGCSPSPCLSENGYRRNLTIDINSSPSSKPEPNLGRNLRREKRVSKRETRVKVLESLSVVILTPTFAGRIGTRERREEERTRSFLLGGIFHPSRGKSRGVRL